MSDFGGVGDFCVLGIASSEPEVCFGQLWPWILALEFSAHADSWSLPAVADPAVCNILCIRQVQWWNTPTYISFRMPSCCSFDADVGNRLWESCGSAKQMQWSQCTRRGVHAIDCAGTGPAGKIPMRIILPTLQMVSMSNLKYPQTVAPFKLSKSDQEMKSSNRTALGDSYMAGVSVSQEWQTQTLISLAIPGISIKIKLHRDRTCLQFYQDFKDIYDIYAWQRLVMVM